jgi:hypothetical protein
MNISSARLCWRYLRGVHWWVGVAFAFFGSVGLLAARLSWQYEERFRSEGVAAVARVTGKESKFEKAGKKQEMHYILLYTFQDAAGRDYQGRELVPNGEWDQVKKGDARAVEYVRDDPAHLEGQQSESPE